MLLKFPSLFTLAFEKPLYLVPKCDHSFSVTGWLDYTSPGHKLYDSHQCCGHDRRKFCNGFWQLFSINLLKATFGWRCRLSVKMLCMCSTKYCAHFLHSFYTSMHLCTVFTFKTFLLIFDSHPVRTNRSYGLCTDYYFCNVCVHKSMATGSGVHIFSLN